MSKYLRISHIVNFVKQKKLVTIFFYHSLCEISAANGFYLILLNNIYTLIRKKTRHRRICDEESVFVLLRSFVACSILSAT